MDCFFGAKKLCLMFVCVCFVLYEYFVWNGFLDLA